MNGDDALRAAVQRLKAAGIDGAARDARWLLAHAMGVSPDKMPAHLDNPLDDTAQKALDAALTAREARQPVSQIIGYREFWGRRFRVTQDVLDPRPETETLIELALEQPFARVLDLGTGSGAILLTLLAERRGATGTGTDISEAALEVAARNSDDLRLSHRAGFQRSNWYRDVGGLFDLIVSNPPYIAADEMPGLAPEVREWEPQTALTDGADGLTAYRAIAAGAGAHLAPHGRVIVETGPTQGPAVAAIFAAAGLENVTCHPDIDGRQRAVSALKT